MTTSGKTRFRARNLRRRSWLLWGVTFAVMLALTAAVPLLYLPVIAAIDRDSPESGFAQNTYYALVGLSGMVLIFCLYTALKHRELDKMRDALSREEQETEDVRTRLLELSAMFQVATTLNLQLRLDVILELIVRRVVSALRAQQASIMLHDPATGELQTRATYGLEAEFARHGRARMGEGIAGWVAQRGIGLLLNPGATAGEMAGHFKAERHITSALSMPLRVGERCVGVLNVNRINHPETFEDHHRDVLLMFAEHVAAVIERAEVMDRMGSRSRELEEDNVRLTQLNEMKDVFLSTASHELKTPLTSVIAYAELLEDKAARLSEPQRHEFLDRLSAEARRLMGLIEDILDLTRLESGKLTLKPVMISPNDIVTAAIETVRAQAAKHHIALRAEILEGLPPMRLDEVKMGQVITNLLVNAVKFSPEHGTISVNTSREPKYVKIEVRDEGPGIHPEDATHIFELFGQGVHGKELRGGGLGIGLHLVKRITEMHGGLVGVNSIPGKGSQFWVRLPVTLAEAQQDVLQSAA